jgi:hypothetical protein
VADQAGDEAEQCRDKRHGGQRDYNRYDIHARFVLNITRARDCIICIIQ